MAASGTVRNSVWLVVAALTCIAALLGLRYAPSALRLGRTGVIVRRPDRSTRVKADDRRNLANIAPLATVTVSSEDTSTGQTGQGVADGRPDGSEWSRAGQGAGARITLSWARPARASEIDLYDQRKRLDNVRSGTMT